MESVSIMELLRKKMINGRISKEVKLVGSGNAFPQCLWSIYIIEEQGYMVEELEFHQDNMSDMIT